MPSTKYQYFATTIANLLSMSYGIACGWPSPNLPYLSSDETPLNTKLSIDEKSYIAALVCAGGFVGNLLFAWISNKYGRRYPLMSIAVPQFFGWMLKLYAQNAYYLYVARFAIGLVGGGVFVIVPVFIAEIADDRIRGTLGSTLVLSCNIGLLLAFIFGEYCTYDFTPIFVMASTLIFLLGFYFFPETPAVLFKRNRLEEAEESLRFYRNINRKSKTEMEYLHLEFNKLQCTYAEEKPKCPNEASALRWSDFTSTVARKAMLIGIVLAALNQLCGCFAMMNYTSTIFKEAGSNLSPNASAIVVGAIQLLGAYVSTILVDRSGRRLLIGISATATSLGLACLGVYLYVRSIGCDVESFGWIPISCFSFVIFFANWGVLTLPFLVISEILPEKIKNAGSSFCMSIIWLLAFFMVKYFPMLSATLGMHGSMFLFSGFSIAGAIFVLTVMPETKGKSFEQIMELLR